MKTDELLPAHLRTAEGVTWGEEGSLATGWVNGAKATSREHFIEEMGKLGLRLCINCSVMDELDEDQFMFDPLCPKVVNLHERARKKLAASALVKSYAFVFLVSNHNFSGMESGMINGQIIRDDLLFILNILNAKYNRVFVVRFS